MITYYVIKLPYNRKDSKKMGERVQPMKFINMRTVWRYL